MVTVQEYLNQKYPTSEAKKVVEEIDVDKINQERKSQGINELLTGGELNLFEYPNLKKVWIKGGWLKTRLTSLNVNNCKELAELDCHSNELTNLDLTNCSQLKDLNCGCNLLTNLDLTKNCQLESLSLSDNNFPKQNLSFLSHLVNLKELFLKNNDQEKITQGKYNRFIGSLEPLRNLKKLERFSIGNTDLDSGLEYLPKTIKNFRCSTDKRKNARVKEIEEELRKFGDPDHDGNFARLFTLWKEKFDSPAQQWLDKKYSEDGVCQRRGEEDKGWDGSEGWNNEGKKREQIINLDISNKGLKGILRLKGFTELKKLNCSKNQLISLDLSDCLELTWLMCDQNSLCSLNLPQTASKLEVLRVQNNPNLLQDLEIFASFKNLKELDISNCPFGGSLKPLKDLGKLEILIISNTELSEGLEHLPESCEMLFCNSSYPHQSTKLMEELEKSKSFKKISLEKRIKNQALKKILDDHHRKYYIPNNWKIDKANNITASIIPLERLFVIRSNLKQFINKWGNSESKTKLSKIVSAMRKLENEIITYQQGSEQNVVQPVENNQLVNQLEDQNASTIHSRWLKKDNSLSELEQLQTPEQYGKFRYLGGVKWISRATAAVGGILALTGSPEIGGAMAAASPLVDAVASHVEENYYYKKEEKWKEFLNDADTLLDNYHELLGITKSIRVGKIGEVNEKFKSLKKEVEDFLEEFDKDKNGEIDVRELIEKRENLFKSQDENNSEAIINLNIETNQSLNSSSVNLLNKSQQQEEIELQSYILQPTNFPSSSKN